MFVTYTENVVETDNNCSEPPVNAAKLDAVPYDHSLCIKKGPRVVEEKVPRAEKRTMF